MCVFVLLSPGYQYDVSGLFGAAPESHPSYDGGTITGMPVDLFNRKLQVKLSTGNQPPSEAGCCVPPPPGVPPCVCIHTGDSAQLVCQHGMAVAGYVRSQAAVTLADPLVYLGMLLSCNTGPRADTGCHHQP